MTPELLACGQIGTAPAKALAKFHREGGERFSAGWRNGDYDEIDVPVWPRHDFPGYWKSVSAGRL